MEKLDYVYLAELVRKAQLGDSNAFAELYAATYQKQFRYSYQYLRDEYLAQDATQETFIQALKNIGSVKNPELIIAWLNQVNFRICYDMKKKMKNDVMDKDENDYVNERLQAAGQPEDGIILIDSKKYILNQIMSLPVLEAQSIIMRYFQRMSIDEIARNLEVSKSTVKRYLQSGKKRLNRLLNDIGM